MHNRRNEEIRNLEIERRRAELFKNYHEIWGRMLDEFMGDDSDSLWLTYSANYLLRTGGVRWAVDPLTVHGRFLGRDSGYHEEISAEEMRRLEPLSFVLLTHNHDDHLDISLARALMDFPIKWVMPEDMKKILKERAGAKDKNIIIPEHGKPLVINDTKITAFEGLHRRVEPFKMHIPSNIYLVETAGRSYLFPGDVRTYDADFIPFSGPVNWVFSHLWLGVNSMDDNLPILSEYCEFALKFSPGNILISHVYEVGRSAGDYWSEEHVEMAAAMWKKLAPGIKVFTPEIGEKVKLS